MGQLSFLSIFCLNEIYFSIHWEAGGMSGGMFLTFFFFFLHFVHLLPFFTRGHTHSLHGWQGIKIVWLLLLRGWAVRYQTPEVRKSRIWMGKKKQISDEFKIALRPQVFSKGSSFHPSVNRKALLVRLELSGCLKSFPSHVVSPTLDQWNISPWPLFSGL